MTPEVLTALLGSAVVLIVSVGFPLFLRRQDRRERAGSDEVVSWQSLTNAIKDERDLARTDRNTALGRVETREAEHRQVVKRLEDEHRAALTRLETSWQAKHEIALARIRTLEAEVADLYRTQGRQQRRNE